MASPHRIERCFDLDGYYRYRGVTVARDDSQRGHWGHWRVAYGLAASNGGLRAETRKQLLAKIDQLLDAPASAAHHN